ncbi:MAG TPA: hypothetical protein DHB48_13040 [Sphingobium sp.]|nr:hypothetical protein [Sphingobium sp.]MBS90576.1 hypothetical protein [Sphingobium sp.]HCW61899.1 hypothetical protein [Sphingobium sp.]
MYGCPPVIDDEDAPLRRLCDARTGRAKGFAGFDASAISAQDRDTATDIRHNESTIWPMNGTDGGAQT